VRHGVGVEVCAGFNFRPAFHHANIHTGTRQVRGQSTPAGPGTYNYNVIASSCHFAIHLIAKMI
jgi:hypothetical protein